MKDPVLHLLEIAGVGHIRGGGEPYRANCPFCHDKSVPFWYFRSMNLWGCWSVKCRFRKGGKPLHLLLAIGWDIRRALAFVQQHNLHVTHPAMAIPQERTTLKKTYLRAWDIDWDAVSNSQLDIPILRWVLGRQITSDTLTAFRVGYDRWNRGITIPLFNVDRDFVLLCRRKNRYIVKACSCPRMCECNVRAQRHDVLFGHNLLPEKSKDPLVVVEGYFDAMKVWQHGYDVVALLSNRATRTQAEVLSKIQRPLILFLDGDPAGVWGTLQTLKRLTHRPDTRVAWYFPPQTKDAGDPGFDAFTLHLTIKRSESVNYFISHYPDHFRRATLRMQGLRSGS